MIIRTYSELIKLPTFEERFRYLKLDGKVGETTFGFQRFVNQQLYHSSDWMAFRDEVIIRDNGCDLGVTGHDIFGTVLIHHLNPITYEDIINRAPCIFDMDNVICTQLITLIMLFIMETKVSSYKYLCKEAGTTLVRGKNNERKIYERT